MVVIPDSPEEFFTRFLPSQFAAVAGGFAGKSSAGAMVFRVIGAGEWSLRLASGALEVSPGASPDAVVQLTLAADDFVPLLVESARAQAGKPITPERQVIAFKALTVEADRAKLVRAIPGSMAFAVRDGELTRRLAITPGSRLAKVEDAECRLECEMSDFQDMQAGKANPMQLVMGGKMKIVGNAQIPMALSTVFV